MEDLVDLVSLFVWIVVLYITVIYLERNRIDKDE